MKCIFNILNNYKLFIKFYKNKRIIDNKNTYTLIIKK